MNINLMSKTHFDSMNTMEQQQWKLHRHLLKNISAASVGYRGCIGFGIAIDPTFTDKWIEIRSIETHVLIPDRTIRWLVLLDIPPGYFRMKHTREVHWATVRPTTILFGMPVLARGSEEHSWDFRAIPCDETKIHLENGQEIIVEHNPNVLPPKDYPQLFRAFNAIELAMTSTAFCFRKSWQDKKKALFDALGENYMSDKNLLLFGEEHFDSIQRPIVWMPRAYLGFSRSSWQKLYCRTTRPYNITMPFYSVGLQTALLRDLENNLAYAAPFDGKVENIQYEIYEGLPVYRFDLKGELDEIYVIRFTRDARIRYRKGEYFRMGDIICEETLKVPENFNEKSLGFKWDFWLLKMIDRSYLDAFIRIWWDRQRIELKQDIIHMPVDLVSTAAYNNSIDDELMWDVSPSMSYFSETCDSFIFPTINNHKWSNFIGTLPGDVAFDFTPVDSRYLTVEEGYQRKRYAKELKMNAKYNRCN